MNLCDACETAAWCSKNGCIPIQQPEPLDFAAAAKAILARVFTGEIGPAEANRMVNEWSSNRAVDAVLKGRE